MTINSRTLSIGLLAVAAACSPKTDDASSAAADGAPPSPSGFQVTETGIGPLMAGMSVARGEAILKTSLAAPAGSDSSGCRYAAWGGGPPGLRLMIEGNDIVRVDVDSGPVATSTGARVGDTEERILSLYPGRVAVGPHKYTKGHYLTVTPANPADSAFRLIFETDGKVVTRYRSGKRPQVEYVEGCG